MGLYWSTRGSPHPAHLEQKTVPKATLAFAKPSSLPPQEGRSDTGSRFMLCAWPRGEGVAVEVQGTGFRGFLHTIVVTATTRGKHSHESL